MPPNPPSTNSQQPVNSGKTTCPFAAQKPCDADELLIKVEFNDRASPGNEDGAKVTRELKTTTRKRKPMASKKVGRNTVRTRNYPTLSWGMNDQLAKYDFVIDAFADQPKSEKKLKAKITAKAKFYGLNCERQSHGLVKMKSFSGQDKDLPAMTSKKVDQASNNLAPQEFSAVHFPYLDNNFSDVNPDGELGGGGAASAMFLFEFFASIFGAMTPKEIEVIAYGCGKRAKEAPLPVNTDLRGLVRIFRKDTWTIGVKIPALGEFKREGSATRTLTTGATEGKFEQSGRLGSSSSSREVTSTNRGNGVTSTEVKQESWSGGQGQSLTTSRTNYGGAINKIESQSQYSDRAGSELRGYTKNGGVYGKPTRQLVEERLAQTSGFDLTIARNGVELPVMKTLEKLKKGVETFAKTLAEVQEMFKKAPQVGWKATFEISALAGTLVFEFGPKLEAPTADGRYLPVNYTVDCKIKLEIINLKIALSFGLEAMALDTGLVLKLEGSLFLKVGIDADVNLDLIKNPVKEIGVDASTGGKLEVIGYVSVVGKTVAEASLSVSAALEFKEGKLLIDVTKPAFDLKGVLKTTPVEVKGTIKVPWWWDKKIDPPIQLLPGSVVHTFK